MGFSNQTSKIITVVEIAIIVIFEIILLLTAGCFTGKSDSALAMAILVQNIYPVTVVPLGLFSSFLINEERWSRNKFYCITVVVFRVAIYLSTYFIATSVDLRLSWPMILTLLPAVVVVDAIAFIHLRK